MKFKNYEVEPLGKLLYSLSLKGKESRMRTRFVSILDAQLRSIIGEEKKELIEQFAQRDESGEVVKSGNDSEMIMLHEDTAQEFYRELDVLMNEYFYIEETEANKMVILSVAETLLDGEFAVSGEDAVLYDKWCEQFEKVAVDYGGEA